MITNRADRNWVENALCAQYPASDDMWNLEGHIGRTAATAAGRAVCSTCPVSADCLAYAIAFGEEYGIWGGQNQKNRKYTARQARAEGVYRRRDSSAVKQNALTRWLKTKPAAVYSDSKQADA